MGSPQSPIADQYKQLEEASELVADITLARQGVALLVIE